MPKLLRVPTEEEQDEYEQNILIPEMFDRVSRQIDKFAEKNKRDAKEIAELDRLIEEKFSKKNKEPEVKKVKKSELKKIIKKAYEDEVITKKKYESLMEQCEDKEYDKIIKYINNNNEILDNI